MVENLEANFEKIVNSVVLAEFKLIKIFPKYKVQLIKKRHPIEEL